MVKVNVLRVFWFLHVFDELKFSVYSDRESARGVFDLMR